MSKILGLLLLVGSPVFAPFCAAQPARDYVFSISGLVTTDDGAPLQEAQVNLDVDGVVYEGVTPVKAAKRITNGAGSFVFMYISHKRGVKYTISVHKEGFEPRTISGSAPPAGQHTVRLKKAGGTP